MRRLKIPVSTARTLHACGEQWGTLLLLAVLALSLALNVILGWRQGEATRKGLAGGRAITVDALPDLSMISVSGRRVTIPMTGGRKKVIFVLSPLCRWCVRNHANVLAIVGAKRDEYQFMAIVQDTTLDGFRRFLAAYPLPFEAFMLGPDPSREVTRATPSTLVIDASGRIEVGWQGAFIGKSGRDVQRFFHVTLPESDSR